MHFYFVSQERGIGLVNQKLQAICNTLWKSKIILNKEGLVQVTQCAGV